MENKFYPIYAVLAILIIAMVAMMCRTASRFVFSIQSFDLNTDEVTVGANSGIAFDKVPHDFMTIKQLDKCYEWTVSPRYLAEDSLIYYFVNNVNPNFHPLGDGSVTVNVPLTNGSTRQVTLSSQDLQGLLSGPKSKYVLLRTILQMQAQDSVSDVDYTTIKALRSCFARTDKDSPWGIVILDKYTSFVQPDGKSIPYVMHGRTDSIEGSKVPAETCKIQFYSMADYSIRPDEVDDEMFHIGKIHYVAKPVLSMTKWGAGHVMLTPVDKGMHVAFPKALTYIERIDSLRKDAAVSSGMLTYQQNDGSFPVARNLLLPVYSSALARDAASLRVNADTLAIVTGPNKFMKVSGKMRLVPGFDKLDLDAGTGTLHAQVGVIDYRFILSYFWLPLLVFTVLLITYCWLMSTKGISSNVRQNMPRLTKNLPAYFSAIFTVALAYGVARIMIAFRLSYSYPYFEKLTGIITISVALMLILLYMLSIVFNSGVVRLERHGRKPIFRLSATALIPLFCLALTWAAFKMMDHGISAAMLSSYYHPSDLGGHNPLYWAKAVAMNDNHRSVPYTLALVNLLLIIVGAFLLNISKRNPLVNWANAVWKATLGPVFKRMKKLPFVAKIKAKLQGGNYFVTLVVGCGLVLTVSLLPGNYSTALITLLAILGLTRTLLSIDYHIPKYRTPTRLVRIVGPKAFWLSMFACICYFTAAFILGDKGYLTNLFGYLCMGIIVYVLAAKESGPTDSYEDNVQDLYRKGIRNAMISFLVLMVFFIKIVLPIILPVDAVTYDRKSQRFNAAWQTERYFDSGYRTANSNQEFFMISDHYMFNNDGSDPLSSTKRVLHSSISTGQSPVILNDVSAQSSFFGTYGVGAFIAFFTLLTVLSWLVLSHTLTKEGELSKQRLYRLMAILLWLSSTIYLYVSYSGLIPFTGRLIPGYGLEAVGEALETSVLLAFMTASPVKKLIK
jgi:hypothetical protein